MAAAKSLRLFALAIAVLAAVAFPASATRRQGKRYRVGGPDGWRVPPPEDKEMYYVNWASPITFYVEDSIEFVYRNDTVMKVDKVGYYHCNETGAGAASRDGSMLFLLDAPGYAYFASADLDHCKMGERLMINVLAVDQPPAPSPSWSPPSPLQQAPAPAPSSWMMSPSSARATDPSVASPSAHAMTAIMLVPVTLALVALI
ncbi:early nodulin-like protein 17 [Phragmites australis]|uniref:early nodulin-like protein 17 n=1 Tax=Phragmites australis TaxID=29695 RepID=UPI002D77BCC8|nr:early nodulin-like protein 17 [Phragmites australis]